MATPSVKISIEKLLEQQVDEISRTGEEKYIRPLTISEELTELAQKIDFDDKRNVSGIEDDSEPEMDSVLLESKGCEEDKKKDESWPWESLQGKLRTTLQEVCVLLDVLQTVKQRKYIVLDPVTQKEEPPKSTVQMLGKRKSLKTAADIICQGARRMMSGKGLESQLKETTPGKDYFHELMKLRQRWRVKKSGNYVVGDLSYKTAGSKFWHQGLFEVSKAEWESEQEALEALEEVLTVKVGSDLEGFTRTLFKVKIKDPDDTYRDIGSRIVDQKMMLSESWQQTLKQSQYNLFCKELFAQLAREAYNCSSYSSSEVSRNEISVKLPGGCSLSIINKKIEGQTPETWSQIKGTEMTEFLRYRAESLLRREHKTTLARGGALQPSMTKSDVQQRKGLFGFFVKSTTQNDKQTLFEKLVLETQHSILRDITAATIDKFAVTCKDPLLSCHWGAIASSTRSGVTVYLKSAKNGFLYRNSFYLEIGTDEYHIVTNSGLAIDLSGQPRRLEDFIRSMVSQHLLEVAQLRFEYFGWSVRQQSKITLLHLFSNCDLNEVTPGILAESKDGVRLSLLIEPENRMRAVLQRQEYFEDDESVNLLLDGEWLKNVQSREEIDFDSLFGKTFVDKLDCLLALLEAPS